MNDAVCTLHRGSAPLLLSLPHDGSAIPAALAERMTPEARRKVMAELPARAATLVKRRGGRAGRTGG